VVVMARSVSEAGMLMTETSFRPADLLTLVAPKAALGNRTLVALSLADGVFTRDLRGNLLSTFLDGLKMSDIVKLDRHHLFIAVAIALVIALTVGGALHLLFPYAVGAVTMYDWVYHGSPLIAPQFYAPALQVADEYDPRLPAFFGSGVLIALVCSIFRMRYSWWPLAPLGFALSGSWSMICFWFPIFVAWLLKSLIIRYGGMKVYNTFRPFFLGLILGEFSQAVLWATLGGVWRINAPFFPWP